MENCAALIIDLKDSRTYQTDKRLIIQEYIFRALHSLNDVFEHSIRKNVEFSGGDEIQGLFSSVEAAYLYVRWFNMLLSPVETYAGIGYGDWSIVLEHGSSTAQDGPAYHNAREAINHAKHAAGYSVLLYSGNSNDIIINSLINTTTLIINKHSEYQNEIMLLSELLFPIDANYIINTYALTEIWHLLEDKKELLDYDYMKRRKGTQRRDYISWNSYKTSISIPTDALDYNSTFYITDGKKKGLSTEIANIMHITRQSIEKTIRIANIYELRNATVAAIKLINETFH